MDFRNVDWNKAVENSLANLENAKNVGSERREVDLTKYFTTYLSDKSDSGEKTIRILPLDETGKWYDVAKFHDVKLGDKYVKLYDPSQDGEESPLNDMYKILINGNEDEKKMASKYRSREFYIVRVIERGKEHEGVKFWRFKKLRDGTGIMDKIEPVIRRLNTKNPGSGAIFNPIAGRDLVISIKRDYSKPYKNPVYMVTSIMPDDPSPLSSDDTQMMEWLNDSNTWKSMYPKKNLEYLRIIAQGDEPVWNSDLKKFVGVNSIIDTHSSDTDNSEPPTELGSYFNKMPTRSTDIPDDEDTSEPKLVINDEDLPF